MRRIEWVQARLNNWALWLVRERSGGLGYATQSVLLSTVVDSTREVRLPVDEVDAAETHELVGTLRDSAPHLHQVLHLYYAKGIGIKGAAREMGRAESTIKSNLAQADNRLALLFAERKQAREERARQWKGAAGGFTA